MYLLIQVQGKGTYIVYMHLLMHVSSDFLLYLFSGSLSLHVSYSLHISLFFSRHSKFRISFDPQEKCIYQEL